MTAITTTTMAITQVLDSVCLSVLDDLAMHLFYYKSGVGVVENAANMANGSWVTEQKRSPVGSYNLKTGGSRGARTPDLLGVNEAL